MEADLSLMTDNAKRYNEPRSIIYKDASKLKRLTVDTYKELNGLINKGKQKESTKTREKKRKLVEEIAAGNGLDDPSLLVPSNYTPTEHEDNHNHDDEEEEDEDEEEDDDDEEEADLNESNDNTANKRGRRKSNNHLMPTLWSLFDYMKEYRHSNHTLIDPFIKLPSKRFYPDYYEEIKKPIALNGIKKKLNTRVYQSVKELVDDFELMFKNAMQYNVEESLIYKDAKRLREALAQKSAELPLIVSTNMTASHSGAPSPAIGANSTTPKKKQQQSKLLQNEHDTKLTALPKFADLKEKLIYLYNYINDFQLDGRELAPPFRGLPSKLDYPDYYTVIKKPMEMTKIWNKINHVNTYASLDEMCYDFAQMFENACIYNEPSSKIYKDALSLQQAVFMKRDEIINADLNASSLTSSNCFNSKDPINEYQNEVEYIKRNDALTSDFVQNAVQCLFKHLFESVMSYQDLEGRTLSDSFVDLYYLYDKKKQVEPEFILTFELIKTRLYSGYYHRLDVFQDEIFQVFNQIRTIEFDSHKINEHSQLYRDAYDLQRYFILKRDEVCRNGDLMQSNAASIKYTVLEAQIAAIKGHAPINYDEAELLSVEKNFKILESSLSLSDTSENKYQIGNFYLIERELIIANLSNKERFNLDSNLKNPFICCVLASNSPQTKIVVQIYLESSDTEFLENESKKTRKSFDQEVYRTDLFIPIELNNVTFKQCYVVGVKEFMHLEPIYNETIKKELLYVNESIYSTEFKFFRKIATKKWTPTGICSASASSANSTQVPMNRRIAPIIINRYYQDDSFINDLVNRVNSTITQIAANKPLFKPFQRQTVEYESLPAAFLAAANAKEEKEADELEPTTTTVADEDPELMKTAKYYEQLIYSKDGELYRVGDYVYVKHQFNETRPPMIVRIDRLWSVVLNNEVVFYLKGALFLRPSDITHEPTRLFYKNEVFKEISKEITASLDQIVYSDMNTNRKKCTVMNAKKYVSCRLTEIDENDVYVCDSKYSLVLKTFRKFTKGLKKFELSMKCCEDEVYFLRRELQLRKHLSPFLLNLSINYDEEYQIQNPDSNGAYGMDNNDSNEEDWSDGEGMRDDENSSHSFNINHLHNENSNGVSSPSMFRNNNKLNPNTKYEYSADGSLIKQKKIRVKRLKKSGYNLFSKDLRKRLRDTKSSLSFVNMSKEVGNRWRELSDKERAAYEERAKIESIKEQQAAAAAAAAINNSSNNIQPQSYSSSSLASPHNHHHHMQQQQPSTMHQVYSNTPQAIYIHQTTNGGIVAKQSPIVMQNQNYSPSQIYQQNGGTTYMTQQQAQIYEQPQQTIQVQAAPPPPPPKPEGPRQVLHKEAYIKYIANMRRQQQLYQSNNISASITGITPDWYNSIDVRSNRIKESKVAPPPAYLVESCSHNDVVKHLMSLRYYLLNDAINIDRYSVDNSNKIEKNMNNGVDEEENTDIELV